jgi:hypothetical protein
MLGMIVALGCGGNEREKEKLGKPEQIDMSILTEEERNLVASVERLKAQVDGSLQKALKWLEGQAEPDGSYPGNIGVTSLALMAFIKQPNFNEDLIPARVRRGASYIASNLKSGDVTQMALALTALIYLDDPAYRDLIAEGLEFLMQAQMDEGEGISPDDPNYGGFPSDVEGAKGDIHTTVFALIALKEGMVEPDNPVWRKALAFLNHCQHYDEVNDLSWAVTNNGGFITSPSDSLAGLDENDRPIPYGSATYAGLLGYLLCGLDPHDMPVRAAIKWVMNNFTFDGNPGLGYKEVGLYYYLMAKSLGTLGDFTILDSQGRQHRWFNELFVKLKSLQDPDGFWRFESPIQDTVFAALALEEGYPQEYPIPGLKFRMKGRKPKEGG